MLKLSTVLYLVAFLYAVWSLEFRQEGAKLTYSNPKYIADTVMLTRRLSRHDPYRTNLTGTLLMPYGNNVTFALILRLKSGGDFTIRAKVCDTVKSKWMREYMQQYTNITLDRCPFPAGRYSYLNMELPPKNLPIPVMSGDYYIIMELAITATKEKILQASTLIKIVADTKKPQRKDKNDRKGRIFVKNNVTNRRYT